MDPGQLWLWHSQTFQLHTLKKKGGEICGEGQALQVTLKFFAGSETTWRRDEQKRCARDWEAETRVRSLPYLFLLSGPEQSLSKGPIRISAQLICEMGVVSSAYSWGKLRIWDHTCECLEALLLESRKVQKNRCGVSGNLLLILSDPRTLSKSCIFGPFQRCQKIPPVRWWRWMCTTSKTPCLYLLS